MNLTDILFSLPDSQQTMQVMRALIQAHELGKRSATVTPIRPIPELPAFLKRQAN